MTTKVYGDGVVELDTIFDFPYFRVDGGEWELVETVPQRIVEEAMERVGSIEEFRLLVESL